MNSGLPDPLERFVDRACRGQPSLKAPGSLVARVESELERRAALPRWRRSFRHWAVPLRMALVVAGLGAAALSLTISGWPRGGVATAGIAPLRGTWGWIDGAGDWLLFPYRLIDEVSAAFVRSIPSPWLYGSLIGIGMLYGLLAGLGATAYRTLYLGHAATLKVHP